MNFKTMNTTRCLKTVMALCCVAGLVTGCKKIDTQTPVAAVSTAPADLAGVWQLAQPMTTLFTVDGKLPPLLPEARKLYDERVARRKAGDISWDPAQHCKPLGEPRAMMEMAWPFQILQSEGRIDIGYQYNRLLHTIPIRAEHGPQKGPFYFGESAGRWEGDTLVVDIINIREESMLDIAGLPHSDELHMVERFRVLNGGKQLEVRFHFEDARTYAQPWDAVLTFDKQPDLLIKEDVCFERLKINDYATLDNSLK